MNNIYLNILDKAVKSKRGRILLSKRYVIITYIVHLLNIKILTIDHNEC